MLSGAVVLLIRLIDLQIVDHDKYLESPNPSTVRNVEVQAARGTVYDRNGEPLAMSVEADTRRRQSRAGFPILPSLRTFSRPSTRNGRQAVAREDRAGNRNKRGFLYVKRKITDEESQSAAQLRSRLDRVSQAKACASIRRSSARPTSSAASITRSRGNNGIERSLNKYLRGIPGEMRTQADVRHAVFDRKYFTDPQPGRNIKLTIDERIQFVAERELKQAVEVNKCTTGSIVVMNPKTGEILAMTSYPDVQSERSAWRRVRT